MLDGHARGIDVNIIVTFPVPGRSDWPRAKTSAAVWAHIIKDVLDAGPAKCAFKRANHSDCRIGRKRRVTILACRS
jgi:hypothetical protein